MDGVDVSLADLVHRESQTLSARVVLARPYATPRQFLAEMRPNARHSPRLPPPWYMLLHTEPNSPALYRWGMG